MGDAEMELVRRLQEADQAAYAELCRRFVAPLHGFAASRLAGDDDLAEEVAVSTLVGAVKNIRRFSPRRSTLSAWLYGIARRQIELARRKQRRMKSVPPSARVSVHALPEAADGDDMAAGLAARLDAERRVAELSRFLPEIEMEVLILHCADGLSAKEIGRIIGRSERGVESLLHRAKQRARERLGSDAE